MFSHNPHFITFNQLTICVAILDHRTTTKKELMDFKHVKSATNTRFITLSQIFKTFNV